MGKPDPPELLEKDHTMRDYRFKLARFLVLLAMISGLVDWAGSKVAAGEVKLEGTVESGFRLVRNGEPFFVRGVGLTNGSMAAVAKLGANSVRTWGAETLGKVLDEAQSNGLTVCAGIWLGHERHGFRYSDKQALQKQADEVRKVVLQFKDHPALLVWGLGNEMEADGSNPDIWNAVNDLARMVKELDPKHPTMTVIAELGDNGRKVRQVHSLCPAIDILGINSYGTAATVTERYKAAGGTRPYLVTEFGPRGWWESKKTEWGAALEPTSTEKGETYRQTYNATVANQPLCLGSYAFLWGWKQEATATWFGLVMPDGSRVAATDVMSEFWTGKAPINHCPVVEPLKSDGGIVSADPGKTLTVRLKAMDPEGDPLQVTWSLQREGTPAGGGDAEPDPPSFPDELVEKTNDHVVIRLPAQGGGFRVFATVRDDHGGAATANLPIRSAGAGITDNVIKPRLPLVLDPETDIPTLFQPTGWMGNTNAMAMEPNFQIAPHDGKRCLKIDYKQGSDWGGVVWQYPASDWGDKPGALDLSGAKKLSFWAKGEHGGEAVTFKFGLLGPEKAFSDSARGQTGEVKLTDQWTQYEIDLKGMDLSRIKTGFCWVLAAHGQPVTFFLDEIRYE